MTESGEVQCQPKICQIMMDYLGVTGGINETFNCLFLYPMRWDRCFILPHFAQCSVPQLVSILLKRISVGNILSPPLYDQVA